MYRPQSGHMSRPPSPSRPRPAHQSLPIRTSSQQTPTYPLPISPEKFPKALKLYIRYRLEEGLAQRVPEPQSATDGSQRLNIPPRAHSLASPASSRAYTPSVSTSAYEGATDLSSLISFASDESPTSATQNGNTDFISFNGERVKQRVRRPLSPRSKAKAALIRHLESCRSCRARRVPCPLDHHDIDSLERARRVKIRKRAQSQQQHSQSSISGFSNQLSESRSTDQLASGGTRGQDNTLLGLGQHLQTISSDPTAVDALSPAYDPLAGIQVPPQAYHDTPGPINLLVPSFSIDPYSTYSDGQMFPLGVLRGFFHCQHLDGLCNQVFGDAEALQNHFETDHFAFTRIYPATRNVCLSCQQFNNYPIGPCHHCRTEGPFEIWVYANYVRAPALHRYAPDPQDFLRNGPTSEPFFSSFYAISNMDYQQGGGGNNHNFTGMNPGGFYGFQNDNNYQADGSQGDEGDGYHTPRSGGFPYQANYTRQSAEVRPFTARSWYAKPMQTYHYHRLLVLTFALSVTITLIYQAHEWLFTKARLFTPRTYSNFPLVGFVGLLASFAICYKYWSIKCLRVQRVRRAQCRPHRCPLHDLPTMSIHYTQPAPNTFLRGGVFL